MKLRAPRWVRRLMAIFRWSAQDRDMDQEMGFHIDAMTREYMRGGMSEADAARAARKQFGNVLRHKEAGHDTRSGHLDELVQDVKSGLRQLTGAPTFAVVAAITLALGIGVNAAVFAVVKSALLDALPYTEADRLVRVYGGARAQLQRGPLHDTARGDPAGASRAPCMGIDSAASRSPAATGHRPPPTSMGAAYPHRRRARTRSRRAHSPAGRGGPTHWRSRRPAM